MHRYIRLVLIALAFISQGCTGGSTPTTETIPPGPSDVAPTSVVVRAKEPIASVDLTAFAEAWSERDIARIRSFHSDNAVYISDEEIVALERGEQISPYIADDMCGSRLSACEGLRM